MSHRPLWISNFTKPSSRIFSRRDWQASSFTTLARFMTSWTLSGFSRSALRIFSRSFSTTAPYKPGKPDPHARISRLHHHEFDLAVLEDSLRKSVACHLFDDRPMCEKVLLGLYLRR